MNGFRRIALLITAGVVLAACGKSTKLPPQASVGPNPQLPGPTTTLIPTLKVSKAIGWTGDAMPKLQGDTTGRKPRPSA